MADPRFGKQLRTLAGMEDSDEVETGYGVVPEFTREGTFYKGTNIPYGPQAYTRFTKTPIYFSDPAYREGTGLPKKDYVTGEFYPASTIGNKTPASITIEAGRKNPYWDVTEAIGHEDVHAALEKGGAQNRDTWKSPPIVSYPWSYPPDQRNSLDFFSMRGIQEAAEKGFREQHRAGDPDFEIPAYVAASPRDLGPDFTEDMRQLYLKSFESHLSPDVAKLIQRIAQNYSNSLKSPFVKVEKK